MAFLSYLCFCTAPFALFCSANGNGLFLCPMFVVLGFVFKWVGKNCSTANRTVIKVEPQDFWEWHYIDRMNMLNEGGSVKDELMAFRDKEARRWATRICGYHNAWVPPSATQERIARSHGFITEKMVKESAARNDKVQIGKHLLLKELEEKYHGKRFGECGRGERCCSPRTIIKDDRYKIRLSDGCGINEKLIEYDYKMSMQAIWDNMPKSEKDEAIRWIKKYEEKLLEQVDAYIKGGRYFRSVDIDF